LKGEEKGEGESLFEDKTLNSKSFKPRGLATAIGSMPHADPAEAGALALRYLPDIPVWPQLPNRSFLENMYAQYSEGLPGVVIEGEHIYIDRAKDLSEGLERLYAAYLAEDNAQAAISPDYASGLHWFLNQKLDSAVAVKGQVTGPISFGLVVTDRDRRPTLYDETMADAIAKHLRLKAAWQERELRRLHPNTIMFIDEPYLASLGSAFVALSNETVIRLIDEVLGGIRGLKGIHCCGNTDWSVLMATGIDILNFDAYTYGESLGLYPAELKAFLARGGVLAWGIVPSDEVALGKESVAGLVSRLERLIGMLSSKGVSRDLLFEQSLISPSCGLASLSPKGAEKALELTAGVSRSYRANHEDHEEH